MDFAPDDEQEAVLDTVDRLVERHLPMAAQRRRDADHDPPYGLLPVLGEAGLLRLPFAQAHGGLGGDWGTVALVQERLGQRAWMLGSLFNRAVGFGGMSLVSYASDAQRDTLMPRLMEGRLLVALALSEPGAGSDAAAIATTARRTDRGWHLAGSKQWISDAEAADGMVVVARAPETRRASGISLFWVARGTPGVTFAPIPKIGNNCLPSFEVSLDADLPDDALMGREGEGFAHLATTLHYARAGMAAAVTGYAQLGVDIALDHARERRQFGRPLGSFQAIAHRLADMQMRVDQSRLVARELAWRIATGRPCTRQAAQAKVIATECLQWVAHHGMQIMASAGYHADSDMARIWRDSRLYSFGEGSNEIQRGLIARDLGLEGR
jgi:alkylation response protein AidB-like acyl-CoA dehydrogenase